MRIDSMDAKNLPLSKAQDLKDTEDVKENKNIQQISSISLENKIISQMTDYEKNVLPISEKVVIDAIERANRAISVANRRFEYSIHERTKEIMIKVIDTDTNEIIREIPPEKILDMVAKMWDMAGIMVDERR